MDNKELIRKSLMGDREAQEECAEKGIALPCPLCGDDVTITEIPAHKHCIVNLPEYGGGCFIECDNCTYAISGDDVMDALRTHNARPAPPIGRCKDCVWSREPTKEDYTEIGRDVLAYKDSLMCGFCEDARWKDDFCSYFQPK